MFNIFYLKILNKDGSELFCEKAIKSARCTPENTPRGDKIILHCDEGSFVKMQLDESLKEHCLSPVGGF